MLLVNLDSTLCDMRLVNAHNTKYSVFHYTSLTFDRITELGNDYLTHELIFVCITIYLHTVVNMEQA
jgi:hypothetical protein